MHCFPRSRSSLQSGETPHGLAHILVSAIALLLQLRSGEPVHAEGKDGSIEDDVGNVGTGGVEGLLGDLPPAVPLFDVLVLREPSRTHAHVAAVILWEEKKGRNKVRKTIPR